MIDTLALALDGAWKVLLVGLLLGTGLPVLFAIGVRSLAQGTEDGVSSGRRQADTAVAYLCFGLVVLGVMAGIGAIVASGFDVDLGSLID